MTQQLAFGDPDPEPEPPAWSALTLYRLCTIPRVGATSPLRLARAFPRGWDQMAAATPTQLAEVAPRSGAAALAGTVEPDLDLPDVDLPDGSWQVIGHFDPDYPAGLRELTDADLRELGLTLGHRKRLLRAIAALGCDGTGEAAARDASGAAQTGRAGRRRPV